MAQDIEKKYRQWTLKADDNSYALENLGEGGLRQYYAVSMGKYGQPLIEAEPDLAFEPSMNLEYVDASGSPVQPSEKIAGIICQGGPRFSLTNARNQGYTFQTTKEGSIVIADKHGNTGVWWLATLFQKDKNRIIGYDAYLCQDRPETVRILELGDLDLF